METQPLFDNPVALLVLLVFYAVVIAFTVYVYVRIVRKAGFSGWWVLTAFVPVVNLVMLVVFAFVEWPVERRAREAVRYGGGYGQVGGSGRFGQAGGTGYGQVGGPGYGGPAPEGPPRT